jgi:hypothetical protein
MRGSRQLLVAAVGLAGCSHPGAGAPTAGGTVTVEFKASAPRTAGLTLTGGTLSLVHLGLFGDVLASAQAMHDQTALDPTAAAVQAVTFADLPQGIYSQLEFNVATVSVDGTYHGAPLEVRFDIAGPRIDLRAAPPPELLAGDTIRLPVTLDADVWWHDVDLSQATIVDGKILIDSFHNADLGITLERGLGGCFTLGTPR